MRKFETVLTLSSLMLVLQLFALGQAQTNKQDETAVIRAGANVVTVPVVVTDKQGHHIMGLKKDDFEIEENGKRQKLEFFDAVQPTDITPVQRPPQPQPNAYTNEIVTDQNPKRLVIVALDLAGATFDNQAYARQGVIDFLKKELNDKNSLLALVVIDDFGVHMIHDFTTDASVLLAALQQIKPSNNPASGALVSSTSGLASATQEADNLATVLQNMNANPTAIMKAHGQADFDRAMYGVALSRQGLAAITVVQALQYLAQYFAVVPGRKTLIWATTGFPFTLSSSMTELTGGVSQDLFQRTMQMLNNANISVYPVDIQGLLGARPPSTQPSPTIDMSGNSANINQRSSQLNSMQAQVLHDPHEDLINTMRAVAGATGGVASYNHNDLGGSFVRAADDSSSYYVLGYYVTDTNKEGWRKLKVKVDHPGTEVRARDGYFYTKASYDPMASRRIDEMVALRSPLDYTTLPLLVAWQKTEKEGRLRKEQFMIVVPPESVQIDTANKNHVSLDFLALARDDSGAIVMKTPMSQMYDHNLPADGASQVRKYGVTYKNELTLPPGKYQVRFVVRDNVSGRMGSVMVPLTVQ